MSFTIEIPDALAERLRRAAEARGEDLNHYAVAKLERPDDDTDPTGVSDSEEDMDEGLIEALREGLAQVNAGQLRTFEQVDESVEAALAARRKRLQTKAS